ncbi:MAG TPA: hypothetical protein VIL26_09145 [Clostridia bacterium]
MMKKLLNYIISILLLICMVLGVVGCKKDNPNPNSKDEYNQDAFTIDKYYLYGISTPIKQDMNNGASLNNQTYLIGALGATSHRAWMHLTDVLILDEDNNISINTSAASEFHTIYQQLRFRAVEQIIAMNHTWFLPNNQSNPTGGVPNRDTTEGSDYMEFLKLYEKCWYAVAEEFPEIKYWQVGNEFDQDKYIHPLNYDSATGINTFTTEEKAKIAVDMMYYASKGIYAANSDAMVVMPGIGSDKSIDDGSLKNFLTLIYSNIKSGQFPAGKEKSKDTNKYFLVLAWHPHIPDEKVGDTDWIKTSWKSINDEIFSVASANGDGYKKVFFTEFGISDYGRDELDTLAANSFQAAFETMQNMNYLESCHVFRLFEDATAINWGTEKDIYYGLFTENPAYYPKAKARMIQSIYGGVNDIGSLYVDIDTLNAGENIARYASLSASSSAEHPEWSPGWGIKYLVDGVRYNGGGWVNWYNAGHVFSDGTVAEGDGQGAISNTTEEWVQFKFSKSVKVDKIDVYVHEHNTWSETILVLGSTGEKDNNGNLIWKTLVPEVYTPMSPTIHMMSFDLNALKTAGSYKFIKVVFPRLYPTPAGNNNSYLVKMSEIEIYKG